MAVMANKQIKAFCLRPLVAAKYITMKTSRRTDAIDWEVVSPNIFILYKSQYLFGILHNAPSFDEFSLAFIKFKGQVWNSKPIVLNIFNNYSQYPTTVCQISCRTYFKQNQKIEMLSTVRLIKPLRYFCTSIPPPQPNPPSPKPTKLIKIKVENDGQQMQFAFPIYTKLAKNLERAGVPLQFECGYGCSCGTCAIIIKKQDFEIISKHQPVNPNEKKVLMESTQMQGIRLSCQLFVDEYMEGMVFKIQ